MAPSGSPSPKREAVTYIMLAMVLVVGSLVLLVLPIGFFGPVVVFGGWFFGGILAFHYFVWGKWLSRIVEQEDAKDDEPV